MLPIMNRIIIIILVTFMYEIKSITKKIRVVKVTTTVAHDPL